MKTLLILALVIALAAVAFFTRPLQADFANYVRQQSGQTASPELSLKGVLTHYEKGFEIDAYLKSVTFNDHGLYTSVEQNGQTLYTGAFGHWFKNAPAAASTAQPAAK